VSWVMVSGSVRRNAKGLSLRPGTRKINPGAGHHRAVLHAILPLYPLGFSSALSAPTLVRPVRRQGFEATRYTEPCSAPPPRNPPPLSPESESCGNPASPTAGLL